MCQGIFSEHEIEIDPFDLIRGEMKAIEGRSYYCIDVVVGSMVCIFTSFISAVLLLKDEGLVNSTRHISPAQE